MDPPSLVAILFFFFFRLPRCRRLAVSFCLSDFYTLLQAMLDVSRQASERKPACLTARDCKSKKNPPQCSPSMQQAAIAVQSLVTPARHGVHYAVELMMDRDQYITHDRPGQFAVCRTGGIFPQLHQYTVAVRLCSK